MKTKIIISLIGCSLVLFANSSFSQLAFDKVNNADTRQTLLPAKTNTPGSSSTVVVRNIKVERSFIHYFGENAENNWSVIGKDFLNHFHINGLPANALFTKNGELVYVIIYGKEKSMPADLRRMVRSVYYDYIITMAIEVKENKHDIWIVQLSNAAEFITVRIEDDEMEQVQQFQKIN